jgi:hypothetical protein
MTGLLNYVAAVHGRPARVETLEALAAEHIRGDFTAYLRSILDREGIAAVVMDQTGLPDRAEPQTGDFPKDRLVWTYPLIYSLQPDWAIARTRRRSATRWRRSITLETCTSAACAG